MVDTWFPSWCWNQLKWCILCAGEIPMCCLNPHCFLVKFLFPQSWMSSTAPGGTSRCAAKITIQEKPGKKSPRGEVFRTHVDWFLGDYTTNILGIIIIQHGKCGRVGWTRQNGQIICTFSCIRENMLHLNHKNKRSEQKNKNTRPENSHLMIVEGPKSWPIDFQYMEIGKSTIQTWFESRVSTKRAAAVAHGTFCEPADSRALGPIHVTCTGWMAQGFHVHGCNAECFTVHILRHGGVSISCDFTGG